MNIMKKAVCVWDFSPKNVTKWTSNDIRAYYLSTRVPLNVFIHGVTIYPSCVNEDIDVLFYGAVHKRRRMVQEQLRKMKGARIEFRYYDLFQHDREKLI